jgi:flagellar biogenesis protein FliO
MTDLAKTVSVIMVLGWGLALAQEEESFTETPPPELELTDLPSVDSDSNADRFSDIGDAMDRQDDGAGAGTGDAGEAGEKSPLQLFGRSAVALCVVLAMILIAYYLLNRFGNRTPILAGAKLGTIMGRVSLSPKAYLYFVRTANRVLVVGWTPTSINRVAEYDASDFQEFLQSDEGNEAVKSELGPTLRSDFRETLSSQTLEERMIELDMASLDVDEDELAVDMGSLRGEIEQLRAYVRESSHDA